MGWFNDDSDQYQAHDTVTNAPHKAQWSHELIAGAASYEAAKAYEKHQEANGHFDNHAKAKEFLCVLHCLVHFTRRLHWLILLSSIDR